MASSSRTTPAPHVRAISCTHDSPNEVGRPAPVACTECRRKHMRCDTTVPNCMRCVFSGSKCHYLPSRRGLRRRTAVVQPTNTTPSPTALRIECSEQLASTSLGSTLRTTANSSTTWEGRPNEGPVGPPTDSRTSSPLSPQGRTAVLETGHCPNSQDGIVQPMLEALSRPEGTPSRLLPPTEPSRLSPGPSVEDDEALINLYYANFHAAHPILVPRRFYTSQTYPDHLKAVVHAVGSQFSPAASTNALRSFAADTISMVEASPSTAITYHYVQAKLLFSIALHHRNEIQESVKTLAQAASAALEIGMHREAFLTAHGANSALEAESVRRTWWELYVTDGFMAALQRKSSFPCHIAMPDTLLPSDESSYAMGSFASESLSLTQFDAHIYTEEDLTFSSFSYRIGAIRLLARVLCVAATHELDEDCVEEIDSALAAWLHHMDATKIGMTNRSSKGEDEMLFQGHMLIHFCVMYLHFPRSDLVATIPGATHVIRQQQLLPVLTRNTHGSKALAASKQLSKLGTLQVPVQKHTPFFICAAVFAVLVQLSACSMRGLYGSQTQFRDRISLTVGILKTLSPMWALAQVTLRKIRHMASETLSHVESHEVAATVQPTSPNDSGTGFVAHGYDACAADLSWIDMFCWDANLERVL